MRRCGIFILHVLIIIFFFSVSFSHADVLITQRNHGGSTDLPVFDVVNTFDKNVTVHKKTELINCIGNIVRSCDRNYLLGVDSRIVVNSVDDLNQIFDGVYLVKTKILIDENVLGEFSSICGATVDTDKESDCLVGMNAHLERYSASDQWHLLRMMKDAGVRTVILESVFRSKNNDGKYLDNYELDQSLLACEAFGIRPVIKISYFPDVYYNSEVKARMAYDFATYIGEKYKGRCVDWCLGNETNAGWGGFGSASDMTVHNQSMSLALKNVNINNNVATFSIAESLPAYLEDMFISGVGSYVDAISTHPYCGVAEAGIAKLLANRRVIGAYGGKQELWATEMGYHYAPGGKVNSTTQQLTQVNGYTLDQQADQLSRQYLLAKSHGINRVYWYDFFEKSDPETFWIVSENFIPRPAFKSLKIVSSLINNSESLGGTQPNELIQKHIFRKANKSVFMAVWALQDNIECSLGLPEGNYRLYDTLGNVLTYNPVISIGQRPIIIENMNENTGFFCSEEILSNTVDGRNWMLPMNRWDVGLGEVVRIPWSVFNSGKNTITAQLELIEPIPGFAVEIPDPFVVGPGETVVKSVKVTIPKDAVPGVEYRMSFCSNLIGPQRTKPMQIRLWVNGTFPYHHLLENDSKEKVVKRRIVDEDAVGFGRKNLIARYGSVTVDGQLNDWVSSDFYTLEQLGMWKLRDAGIPTREDWFCRGGIKWDDSALYVCFLVLDEDISTIDLTSRDWRDCDNVRIFLSTSPLSERGSTISEKDFLILMAPTRQHQSEDPALMLASIGGFVHENIEGSIKVTSRVWHGGYLIEASIPWSVLNVKPHEEIVFGCNLLGDDSDMGFRQNTGMTYMKNFNYWNDPRTLGSLTLTK